MSDSYSEARALWSPSTIRALVWASGLAELGGRGGTVTSNELFVGLLLAHPDSRGEVWQFLNHFGLTARDLLPDDSPKMDGDDLRKAAAAASGPDPARWDSEVASILDDARARAGGTAQVLHVLAELLARPVWKERLQAGVERFGISANDLVREFNEIVPSLQDAESDSSADASIEQVSLSSSVPAGEQVGRWLARRFPRRPATMASFSNDAPDPGADYIGVSEEADAFAYLITSVALVPPLAIGLFGTWGSGKSFLMAKIRQRVKQLTTMAASDGAAAAEGIWPKVVPIEFNAWQYVETDLWAALLSRIFNELSPEARLKLTELGRKTQRLRAGGDVHLQTQIDAEEKVEALLQAEQDQEKEVEAAAEKVRLLTRQQESMKDAAVRKAFDAQARSAVIDGVGAALGQDVDTAIGEARRFKAAAAVPAWRQKDFWSFWRITWVILAIGAGAVLAWVLAQFVVPPVAITTALAFGTAVLVPILRSAAGFAEDAQAKADEAASKVVDLMKDKITGAGEELKTEQDKIAKIREEIQTERAHAAEALAKRIDLDRQAAQLSAGTLYTDFLSGRNVSDDYRKRLGIVTTVGDDLETLSKLVSEYNDSKEARQLSGPPNRLVLYIDDLDRCPPKRVVEVLEAVHLLLAYPLFVVVVAVDTRWLTAALTEALPILKVKSDTDAPTPTDYLEKIFQIPFWVEPLDIGGRQRLLRGLLLPSVALSEPTSPSPTGTVLEVGEPEQDAAAKMLAVHGPWLDLDAKQFAISPTELAFIEALHPLVEGTPRQVKRFVNICKLLLAMSPPLNGGEGTATERTAVCFMAALHQSKPAFAKQLADAALSATSGTTLEAIVSGLPEPAFVADRAEVQSWLDGRPFAMAPASILVKRWDVIRRLRFAGDEAGA